MVRGMGDAGAVGSYDSLAAPGEVRRGGAQSVANVWSTAERWVKHGDSPPWIEQLGSLVTRRRSLEGGDERQAGRRDQGARSRSTYRPLGSARESGGERQAWNTR